MVEYSVDKETAALDKCLGLLRKSILLAAKADGMYDRVCKKCRESATAADDKVAATAGKFSQLLENHLGNVQHALEHIMIGLGWAYAQELTDAEVEARILEIQEAGDVDALECKHVADNFPELMVLEG